jgi:hypothetical protein
MPIDKPNDEPSLTSGSGRWALSAELVVATAVETFLDDWWTDG